MGLPKTLPLTVTNTGTSTLTVTNVATTDGLYTVDITSFSVVPGGNQIVNVTFGPTAIGAQPAILNITFNPVIPVVLSGSGVLNVSGVSGVSGGKAEEGGPGGPIFAMPLGGEWLIVLGVVACGLWTIRPSKPSDRGDSARGGTA